MRSQIASRRAAAASLCLCLAAPFAALAPLAAEEERVFSTRTIERTLAVTTPCRLSVDNVWGGIRLTGHARPTVEIEAVETVRAESAAAAERASLDVTLEIGEHDGAIDVFVDGPFRHPHDRWSWNDRHRDPGYVVTYDIEVHAPRECDVSVRTVTDGEVEVSNVAGALSVRNVNGGIRLERVAGTGGEIRTVNGPILGTFLRVPTDSLSFDTVNGRIDVTFPPRLAADLTLATNWGEIWSEFDLTPRPAPPPTRRREGGRLVIETGPATLRVGAGGPEISFKTLNGDIFIRKES